MPERFIQRPLYDLSGHLEHAQFVGEVVASWTLVEYQLGALFSFLLRAPPWHGRIAYYAVINANARLDMMRALLAELQLATNEKTAIASILERARTLAGKRNSYVHQIWYEKEGNVYLVEHPKQPLQASQKRRIKLPQMQADLTEIRDFAEECARFVADFSKRHPVQIVGSEIMKTSRGRPW